MFHFQDFVPNQFGKPISGATVTVRVAATPAHTGALATIYSDDGITTKANPLTTNSQGEFDFFVADGSYDLKATGADITDDGTNAWVAVRIFDPHSASAADADWKINSATITTLLQKVGNKIRFADQFAGADAGAKIAAAISDLPVTGGVVDARGLEGAQTASTNPFSGVTKPVLVLLGAALYTISVQWVIPPSVVVIGVARSSDGTDSTIIKAAGGFPVSTALVRLGTGVGNAHGSRIQRCRIDGNSVAGSIGIYSTNAAEGSGGDWLTVTGCEDTAILFDGGANQFFDMDQIEITPPSATAKGMVIKGGAIPGKISNVTGNKGSVPVSPSAIELDNMTGGVFENIHGEFCTDVMLIGVTAACHNVVVDGVVGSGNGPVAQVIHIANFASTGTYRGISASSSTNTLVDDRNGLTFASASYSRILLYCQTTGGAPLVVTNSNIGVSTNNPLAALSLGNGSLADANVLLQLSTGAADSRWLGINRNGAYGLLVGYDISGAFNGAVIRQVHATDPLFLVTASTTKVARLNSSGKFAITAGTSFFGTLDHAITADRTWTFPDFAGTVILDAGTQTIGGAKTFSTSAQVGSSGTALTQIRVYSPSLTPASVAANTSAEQTFTVTGLATSDKVIVNGPVPTAGTGIVNVRVSAADTLAITFGNFTAGALTPVSGTYNIVAVRS